MNVSELFRVYDSWFIHFSLRLPFLLLRQIQKKNIMESSLHRERRKDMPDWIFVLWAGGTALLSYSLVYALRKPFTAAEFEGLQVGGMD